MIIKRVVLIILLSVVLLLPCYAEEETETMGNVTEEAFTETLTVLGEESRGVLEDILGGIALTAFLISICLMLYKNPPKLPKVKNIEEDEQKTIARIIAIYGSLNIAANIAEKKKKQS